MAITFSCSSCGNKLRVADEYAGKQAKCPKCETILRIPTAIAAPPASTPPQPSSNSGSTPFDFPDLSHDSTSHPFDEVSSSAANPFQAPSYTAPARPATAGGKGRHQIVSFGEAYTQGMIRYKKQIGMGALYTLTLLGIGFASGIVGEVISFGFSLTGLLPLIIAGALIAQLFKTCMQSFLNSLSARFGLNVATNREPLDQAFAGKPILPILALNLLFLLICVLIGALAAIPMIIGGVMQHPEPQIFVIISIVIGVVLFLAFSIFCIRYMLFTFFIVDQGVGAFKSLEMSAKFMNGNKLTLFMIFLAIGAVSIPLMILTCGVGVFFVMPFYYTALAVFYLKAIGKYQDIR